VRPSRRPPLHSKSSGRSLRVAGARGVTTERPARGDKLICLRWRPPAPTDTPRPARGGGAPRELANLCLAGRPTGQVCPSWTVARPDARLSRRPGAPPPPPRTRAIYGLVGRLRRRHDCAARLTSRLHAAAADAAGQRVTQIKLMSSSGRQTGTPRASGRKFVQLSSVGLFLRARVCVCLCRHQRQGTPPPTICDLQVSNRRVGARDI
jgi:hypothetical protein